MSAYERPDRAELVGEEVTLELHPWAIKGPTRGVFLGQGERGLSIQVEGGGRFSYRHHEVRALKAVMGEDLCERARFRRRRAFQMMAWCLLLASMAVVAWVAVTH